MSDLVRNPEDGFSRIAAQPPGVFASVGRSFNSASFRVLKARNYVFFKYHLFPLF